MKMTLLVAAFLLAPLLAKAYSPDLLKQCPRAKGLQIKMDMIASNIANLSTTRTPEGGPYKPFTNITCTETTCNFDRDLRTLEHYEPDHPDADADENGYGAYPNVDLMFEMQSMTDANKEFEHVVADCATHQFKK